MEKVILILKDTVKMGHKIDGVCFNQISGSNKEIDMFSKKISSSVNLSVFNSKRNGCLKVIALSLKKTPLLYFLLFDFE